MHNRWFYILLEIVFFFILGGLASLAGFIVGYIRKSPLIAALVGLLLSIISVVVAIAANPIGFFFGLVFGTNLFSQYLLTIVFGVAFSVIGWFLGSRAKGGRHG